MILNHMESGPKRLLPCGGASPSPAAPPTAAVTPKLIGKVLQFSTEQAPQLQLSPQELAALQVLFKKTQPVIAVAFYDELDHDEHSLIPFTGSS